MQQSSKQAIAGFSDVGLQVQPVFGRREGDVGRELGIENVLAIGIEDEIDAAVVRLDAAIGRKGEILAGNGLADAQVRQGDGADIDGDGQREAAAFAGRRLRFGFHRRYRQALKVHDVGGDAIGMERARQQRERRPVDDEVLHLGDGALGVGNGDCADPEAAGQKSRGLGNRDGAVRCRDEFCHPVHGISGGAGHEADDKHGGNGQHENCHDRIADEAQQSPENSDQHAHESDSNLTFVTAC